jgi:hypothetical protein
MRRSHLLLAVALAVATLALPQAASAAPGSTIFAVRGFEYAFTPTVGFFAGVGTGNAGDRAAWNTRVEHDPLGSEPTYITGGEFQMKTISSTGVPDFVRGEYVYQGGTITTIDPGANCTSQRFLVTGALENVATSDTTGGTGTFTATLTHHRTRFFGRCVIYSATVLGNTTFEY